MHLRTLGGQQIGERVTDRDPAPPTCVQGSGRVRGYELEIDPGALQRVRLPPTATPRDDGAEHGVEPLGSDPEVDEARPGDTDIGVARGENLAQADVILVAASTGRTSADLGDLERDVCRPITVLMLLRGLERDTTSRLVEAGRGERGAQGGEELVADHGARTR